MRLQLTALLRLLGADRPLIHASDYQSMTRIACARWTTTYCTIWIDDSCGGTRGVASCCNRTWYPAIVSCTPQFTVAILSWTPVTPHWYCSRLRLKGRPRTERCIQQLQVVESVYYISPENPLASRLSFPFLFLSSPNYHFTTLIPDFAHSAFLYILVHPAWVRNTTGPPAPTAIRSLGFSTETPAPTLHAPKSGSRGLDLFLPPHFG